MLGVEAIDLLNQQFWTSLKTDPDATDVSDPPSLYITGNLFVRGD